MEKQARIRRIAGGVAIAFGLLTVASGSSTLLGALEMGMVVRFVLWFNSLAGLAYVIAGLGLWRNRPWAYPLALAILAATLLVFAGFGLHVALGGASVAFGTIDAIAKRSAVGAKAGLMIVGNSERSRLLWRSCGTRPPGHKSHSTGSQPMAVRIRRLSIALPGCGFVPAACGRYLCKKRQGSRVLLEVLSGRLSVSKGAGLPTRACAVRFAPSLKQSRQRR